MTLKTVPPTLAEARADNVIRLLRAALDRAERGEISAVALAYEATKGGGGFRVAHGAYTYPALLVGHLEAAKHNITRHYLLPDDD